MATKHLIGLLVFGLSVGMFWAQEEKPPEEAPPGSASQPHTLTITPEQKARKNPLRFTAVSVGRGKKLFTTQCAMCHGETGDGKGELVEEMKITTPDFTEPGALTNRTDGELFAILEVGVGVMPDQKRMVENQKWHLVNFLRSLSGKPPEKPTGKEPEEGVILVPQ